MCFYFTSFLQYFYHTGCITPQAWPWCKSAWRRNPTAIAKPDHSTDSHPCKIQPSPTISTAQTQHSTHPLPLKDLHHSEEPQRPSSSKRHTNPAKTNCTLPAAANTNNTSSPYPDPNGQLWHPRHPEQAEHGGGNSEPGRKHSHNQRRAADCARSGPCSRHSNRAASLHRRCQACKPEWQAGASHDCTCQGRAAAGSNNTSGASTTTKGANATSATT